MSLNAKTPLRQPLDSSFPRSLEQRGYSTLETSTPNTALANILTVTGCVESSVHKKLVIAWNRL